MNLVQILHLCIGNIIEYYEELNHEIPEGDIIYIFEALDM